MPTIERKDVDRYLDVVKDYVTFWEDDDVPSVYEAYSGRGMYGKECFGIVTRDPRVISLFLLEIADEYAARNPDEDDPFYEVRELTLSMEVDNMGLSMIYYFPGWTIIPTEESKDNV